MKSNNGIKIENRNLFEHEKKKKVQFALTPQEKHKPHSSDSHHRNTDLKRQKDSNIVVAVRVRPLNPKELETSNIEILKTEGKYVIVNDPVEYNGPEDIFKNRSREQTFVFDYVFDQNSSQVGFY